MRMRLASLPVFDRQVSRKAGFAHRSGANGARTLD
jgi:hypothetical protein